MVAELAFASSDSSAPLGSATQSASAPQMPMKPGRQLPHVAEPEVQVALLALAQAEYEVLLCTVYEPQPRLVVLCIAMLGRWSRFVRSPA